MVFINSASNQDDVDRVLTVYDAVRSQMIIRDKMPTSDLYKVMNASAFLMDSYPHGGCPSLKRFQWVKSS